MSSLAVNAYGWQGLNEDKPDVSKFPGHDAYQNGVVSQGEKATLYVQATDDDIRRIQNKCCCSVDNNGEKNYLFSGYSTDINTLNSCIDKNTGMLDGNKLANDLQTAPYRDKYAPKTDPYTYKENVAALDINWNALNDPSNKDINEKLCNPDGLSSNSNDIKFAFGRAEANPHWGTGGGNQYYCDYKTFNEAIDRGIFVYNEEKSFRECNGTFQRENVSPNEFKKMDDDRDALISQTLSSCKDKNAVTDQEKATSLNKLNDEKIAQINSQTVKNDPGKPYITNPDPAYKYSQTEVATVNTNNTGLPNKVDIDNSQPRGSPEKENSQNSNFQKNIPLTPEAENKDLGLHRENKTLTPEPQNEKVALEGKKTSLLPEPEQKQPLIKSESTPLLPAQRNENASQLKSGNLDPEPKADNIKQQDGSNRNQLTSEGADKMSRLTDETGKDNNSTKLTDGLSKAGPKLE